MLDYSSDGQMVNRQLKLQGGIVRQLERGEATVIASEPYLLGGRQDGASLTMAKEGHCVERTVGKIGTEAGSHGELSVGRRMPAAHKRVA